MALIGRILFVTALVAGCGKGADPTQSGFALRIQGLWAQDIRCARETDARRFAYAQFFEHRADGSGGDWVPAGTEAGYSYEAFTWRVIEEKSPMRGTVAYQYTSGETRIEWQLSDDTHGVSNGALGSPNFFYSQRFDPAAVGCKPDPVQSCQGVVCCNIRNTDIRGSETFDGNYTSCLNAFP